MHYTVFDTPYPVDHLIRALDELTRAGFALTGVAVTSGSPRGSIVEANAQNLAEVRIDFGGPGTVSVETYMTRLELMLGVARLRGGEIAHSGKRADKLQEA